MKYDDENVNEKLQGLIKPKITGKKTMPVTFSLFLTYCSVVGPTLRSGSRERFCEGGGGANPTAGFHGPPPENFSKLNIKYGSYYDFFKVKNHFLMCLFVRKNLIFFLQIHNLESYVQLCFNVN